MKSGIYLVNQTTQNLVPGNAVNLGDTVRKYGCNCVQTGNSITIVGGGYYNIEATITGASTALGTVEVTAYKDGVPIEGATASATVAAGVYVTLPIIATVREVGCCYDTASRITFVWEGDAGTATNFAVKVTKV